VVREAARIAIAIATLCGPAVAGVLSAADVQRIHDYERYVVPAAREIPALRDMGARVDTLIAMAESSDEAFDTGRADFISAVRDLPRIGGRTLEMMVSSLQAIDDPCVFAALEWVALLAEVKAEIEARMAYDAGLLKAYQRSVAAGAPGLGPITLWEERPDATGHWNRFRKILNRVP
jgi:hypothetical protein